MAVFALVGSGLSYMTVRAVRSIGSSHAIKSGPSIGAQNILLMGLESRRYWNGTILPEHILNKLHAGNAQQVAAGTGGNTTNTLILIHIFAGGRKAVGFSIPRDDWVQFAGTIGPQQVGKIDQAYGVSLFYREQQLTAKNKYLGKDRLAFLGNEAGQAAAVATVEKLTGVHIDHFAAINLYGFYELARVLGGVEVCLKHRVYDQKSGANFPAGYQHLNASQALAFVRQRDGLPNGDLDRTHRQQAFVDSVMHQLRTDGVLSDLTKIQALLTVARQYVIVDAGWNLLDFAAQARNLTSGNLVFHTLPIKGYETIDRPGCQRGRSGLHQGHRARCLLLQARRDAAHVQVTGGRPEADGRCVQRQRRQHAGPSHLGGAGARRLQGGQGRDHQLPGHDQGPVRSRRRRPAPIRSPNCSASRP